ncbi:MAG: hypothetical protein V3T86_03225 [Planctomycetota bacterium]
MPHNHVNFWVDFAGKIGVPIFSATLVGCLLAERARLEHWVLLGIGSALIYLQHRIEHHPRT